METIETLTPESFMEKSTEVLEALSNDQVRSKIPLISNWENFDRLKDMQLVRFRGLVQNMLDPEIYLETYQTKNGNNTFSMHKGKFRDNLKLETNEELMYDALENVHAERRPIFMVAIPGLNQWAVDIEKEHSSADGMDIEMNNVPSKGLKRPLDESEQPATESDHMDVDVDNFRAKKLNQSGTELEPKSNTNNSNLSREYLLNSPIVDRPTNACLLKFYDDAAKVSLNDVLDVVGFVSLDANLCGSNREPGEFENFDEICAMNPPPSLIPRIHVISHRALAHTNPLLHDNRHNGDALSDQTKLDCFRDLRTALTQCLFGDEIAADYLFCHLVSTVYVRSDETLGQFSLNITHFPENIQNYTKQLYEIIESLLPATHYFPITVENLNNTEFVPTKDYETGKLNSGLLQLAPHTHLVLDETQLQPGKLESHGIEAVVHISNLIRKQQLNVNFKFYTIDYNSNIPVLILSEGKSMFPSNCHIPVKADADAVSLMNETYVAVKQFLKPKLNVVRRFLTEMRLQDFDMNPENMNMIQEDFIEMRRSFNATAEDLHIMLILSRMLGIIHGKKTLDADSWARAKTMETERRNRIESLPKLQKKSA